MKNINQHRTEHMKKVLTRTTRKITGMHPDISGNVSGIWGNVSGITGDVSGIRGDIDECEITDTERKSGIDITDLIQ